MTDLAELPLHALSAGIQATRLSPVAVIDALLERIERHDDKLHALIARYGGEARRAAEAAEMAIRAGHAVGPLHGIPILLKDLIEIEGRVTTGGSAVWRDRISPVTATIVRKLLAAGMIILGKTHTVEFAMGAWGINQHLGCPWNPWDPVRHRAPGGSSSGSGAAVASRLAPCAIGTDTGGSIRIPAGFCGVTGLKPTHGRISMYGVLPMAPSFDTAGPITRSVEDAAILFQLLQGPDPLDPATLHHPPDNPLPQLRRGVAGMRIAPLPAWARAGTAPEILAAYDATLETLAGLGARLTPVVLPCRFTEMMELVAICAAESYADLADIVEDPDQPVGEVIRARILQGKNISASHYLQLWRRQKQLARDFTAALADVDALLTPTIPVSAPLLSEIGPAEHPTSFTLPVNLLGYCALALPNGMTRDGLPISAQIVCKPHDEAAALRIGWAYEQASQWHRLRPPDV